MNAGATDAWGALCFVAYSCLYWSNGSNCRSHSNCIVNGGRRHSGVMSKATRYMYSRVLTRQPTRHRWGAVNL